MDTAIGQNKRWSLALGTGLSGAALFLIVIVLGLGSHNAGVGAAAARPLLPAIPRPDHVVVVMEENHSYSEIIGSALAPYINGLAGQGALFTNSHGVEHPSQPNYLDLFSGLNQGVVGDSCPNTYTTQNLGSELISAGFTFTGYSEDLPAAGSTICTSGAYARKHSPWINFTTVPTSTNQPFSAYPADYSQLPTLSFVIPNLINDMHDGTIAQGDTWLQTHLQGYAQWAQTHNSLLIVTWDEDDFGATNQVATIFYGPMVVTGQYGELINHFNVLRTLEDMYGLPALGLSAQATPITDVWVGAATPTATSTPISALSATPTASATVCGPSFAVIPSANNGSSLNALHAVVEVAGNDVWSAGTAFDGTRLQTLIEHWDGSAWTVSPSPNSSTTDNVLFGLAAPAGNDMWAVGYALAGSGVPQTLIEHWNGSAWTVSPSPNVGSGANALQAVSARAADDAWAVGTSSTVNGVTQTLIEHWNGSAWTVSASPNQGPGPNMLQAVTARAVDDVWAVGNFANGTALAQTLILHWNGSAWAIVAGPNSGSGSNLLTGVSAFTATDVWAAGTAYDATSIGHSLIEHWNGSAWTVSPSPNVGSGANTLNAITATGPADVWAVGTYNNPSNIYQGLVEHWDGAAWSVVGSSNAGANYNYLTGVARRDSSDLWTVGYYNNPTNVNQTLVTHATSLCGSPTPASGTPTTVASATATRTPGATTTPGSATATPCAIRFTDVTDPTAYYYSAVYYLACRGVISGYADGTFKPFNNTTRAQMTKIVTLAFNLPLVTPPATGTFADVDAGSVFYQLIETAAGRGIVSGYTCGGSDPQTGQAEPCDSGRRPYFRPSNSVTRGQLTKIVVIGAGWTRHSPTNPTFNDVGSGNVFYPFIETAVCHAVISGYNDGTFRPNAAAFRSQIAKISYLAVTNSPATCAP